MAESLFWISFVREGSFAGACIVEAPDAPAALSRADALGIHPGGETATMRIDPADCDAPAYFEAALRHRNVLLTSHEEIEALFGPLGSAKDALDAHQEVTLACEKHSRPS